MNYYDPASYRSPETKTEVRQAAKVLIGLRTLFVLGALLGIVIWNSREDQKTKGNTSSEFNNLKIRKARLYSDLFPAQNSTTLQPQNSL